MSGKTPTGSADGRPAGRLAEFEALYRAHVGAVTAFFARRSRDPQVVTDLTADTFVEAMRSFSSSGPAEGNERPWLYAIVRRVYAKHCERVARRRDATRRDIARQLLDQDETEQLADRIDAEREGRVCLAADELTPGDPAALSGGSNSGGLHELTDGRG